MVGGSVAMERRVNVLNADHSGLCIQSCHGALGMGKLTFFGRVLPERANFGLNPAIVVEQRPDNSDVVLKAAFSIIANQVIVDVDLTGSNLPDLPTLRNVLESAARSIVDLGGYLLGHGYDVELVACLNHQNAETQVFGIDIPVLGEGKDSRVGKFHRYFQEVLASDSAVRALADFREAMKSPWDTGFFCYRAIEAVMQSFRKGDLDKSGAWRDLREKLNVSEEVLRSIEEGAKARRHGEVVATSGEERNAYLQKTHRILERYLELIVRKSASLSCEEFPLLTN